MPQAIAAAAAWVATAATTAAAAAGVSSAAAAAIYTTVHAVAQVAISVGAQVGISALTSPKVGGAGMSGTQVDFQSNPDAGVPYAVGETGTAGVYVYNTVGEAKNRNLLFNTVLSLGPIEAFTGFKADAEEVTFGGLQQAVGGTYANRMWQNRQLGLTPSPAFGPPNTTDAGVLAEWTTAHKLSGLAASWYVLGYDQKTYAGGAPAPVWKIKGVKAYDPRQDSTYPGGSGPQRAGDEATWVWSDNPWVHALTWCLGRRQNGKLVMGLGCATAGLDMAAFVEAANIADANGWTVGGVVYSTDSKWEVLKAFCQAGGGRPIALGARISCLVNAPRVSIATLSGADIEGDPTITATQSRRGRVNAVVPRYRSEDHGWEIVPADPLVVDAYVTADRGEQRTQELEFPLVQDVTQAAQLAAYAVVNSREFGPNIIAVTPAKGWALKPGDCITVTEPEFGLNGQKLIVTDRERNLTTGGRILTCVSETDAKHDYCLGRVGSPPPTPGLTGVDPTPEAPTTAEWVATGATLTDNGVSLPAIVIAGSSESTQVSRLLVRYRPVGATAWVTGPSLDLLDDGDYRVELSSGLTSATTYNVQIAYRSVLGVPSAWTALDDVEAGSYAFDTLGIEDGLLTVFYQATAPTSPERGDVWFDTDAGNAPFQWDGASWIDASNNAAVQAIQFATAAQSTANSKVKVFYQTSAPTASTVGDLWVDTDDAQRRVFRWSGSAWQQIADQTGFNIAAGISGQGALATLNQANWATQVTGFGKPEDYANRSLVYKSIGAPGSPGLNDIWIALDGSGNPIAVYAWNGSSWINGADRTVYNIAAGIAGQGALATLSQVTWATQVTGTGKPADFATKSVVYRQTSAPSGAGTNDIWVRLDGGGNPIAMYAFNGSSWINGADRTIYNVAAGFTGQGALATQSTVTTALIAANAVSRVAYGETSGAMSFSYETQHFAMAYTSSGGAHLVDVYADIGVGPYDPAAGAGVSLYCNGVLIGAGSLRCEEAWGTIGLGFPVSHTPGPGGCNYTVTYQASPGSGPVHANRTSVRVTELQR